MQEFEEDLMRRTNHLREQLRLQEEQLEAARHAFELERSHWEESCCRGDGDGSGAVDMATNGSNLGLGERVMNEVFKEKAKTEKKKKGLF